jgi:dihydrofolate reductase
MDQHKVFNIIVMRNAKNNGIGFNNGMPIRIEADMNYFKEITTQSLLTQNLVIMGKNTYYSIPQKFRPLSERKNCVITSSEDQIHPDVLVCKSLSEALQSKEAQECESIYVIGGEMLYKEALECQPVGGNLFLTEAFCDDSIAFDRFFPEVDMNKYALVHESNIYDANGKRDTKDVKYQFKIFKRVC